MADVSIELNELSHSHQELLSIIFILLIFVFAAKAGVFPLYVWLPGSYYASSFIIITFFSALLARVGVYAILRTSSLFLHNTMNFSRYITLFLALLTIIFRSISAIAYYSIKKIILYNIMTAVGVILVGIAMMSKSGIMSVIYYAIHGILAEIALFLTIGVMYRVTRTSNLKSFGDLIRTYSVLGWSFFIAALSLAGIPPSSGFYGKYFIIKAVSEKGSYISTIIVLLSDLIVLYSVTHIFLYGLFDEPKGYRMNNKISVKQAAIASVTATVITVLFGLSTDALHSFVSETAKSFYDPNVYAKSVLGGRY